MAILNFPSVHEADSNGLVAVGGDLEVPSLLLAYRQGIFPWPISTEFPMAWFSPDPRGILEYKNLHIPRSLKKILSRQDFKVTFNRDFASVIEHCAQANNRKQCGQDGQTTWITPQLKDAYIQFYRAGHAYSVETWQDGELAGGMYGVCLGSYLSGESMFYHKPNASKVALVTLMQHLQENEISWIDTQMVTSVVALLGGSTIPRVDFLERLKNCQSFPKERIFP